MNRYLALWLLCTLLASYVVYSRARIPLGPLPERDAQAWAYAWLAAAASGGPRPDAPESARRYRAAGPILVSAYAQGQLRVRYIGDTDPHGHEFRVQELCVVDELAGAAQLVKGNTSRVPVAIIRGYPWRRDDDASMSTRT